MSDQSSPLQTPGQNPPAAAASTGIKRASPPVPETANNGMALKRPKIATSYSMPPPALSSSISSPIAPASSQPSPQPLAGGVSSPMPFTPNLSSAGVYPQLNRTLSRSTSPAAGSPMMHPPSLNSPAPAGSPLPSTPAPAATPAAGGTNTGKEDPGDFSDALLSAGVDLRAEEQLLSSSLPILSQQQPHQPLGNRTLSDPSMYLGEDLSDLYPPDPLQTHRLAPFLDMRVVRNMVAESALGSDIRIPPLPPQLAAQVASGETKDNDALVLISLACREWLSDILTAAVITARYRRESGVRNSSTSNASDVAKALRHVAIKEKEKEDKYQTEKAQLEIRTGNGFGGSSSDASGSGGTKAGDGASHATEEVMHRQTNATAALMVSGGRKKYSWMTGGGGGSASPAASTPGGSTRKESSGSSHGIRVREAREEPGVVVRDLLSVLENERVGVEKTIAKGWTRLRD
ncbi:transcription initiation factor TFIID component TAF4 family-domain-containing protein [Myxozyma melibiosi]|uniref:Transcription initiation factor TFIID subunit 4 n=1 Tax=Myxozyma melibiosi TaxID=54550 RepID=A0ABR1FAK9_9ASCO